MGLAGIRALGLSLRLFTNVRPRAGRSLYQQREVDALKVRQVTSARRARHDSELFASSLSLREGTAKAPCLEQAQLDAMHGVKWQK